MEFETARRGRLVLPSSGSECNSAVLGRHGVQLSKVRGVVMSVVFSSQLLTWFSDINSPPNRFSKCEISQLTRRLPVSTTWLDGCFAFPTNKFSELGENIFFELDLLLDCVCNNRWIKSNRLYLTRYLLIDLIFWEKWFVIMKVNSAAGCCRFVYWSSWRWTLIIYMCAFANLRRRVNLHNLHNLTSALKVHRNCIR